MFGITQFTAIINPPMGAILAMGKASQQTVVRDGEIGIATDAQRATLSCDHRVIDGAVGAQFLATLRRGDCGAVRRSTAPAQIAVFSGLRDAASHAVVRGGPSCSPDTSYSATSTV